MHQLWTCCVYLEVNCWYIFIEVAQYRITKPLHVQHPGVFTTPEAKRITRNYNRVSGVLLEFEILYHRSWMKKVKRRICEKRKYCLLTSVLMVHWNTRAIFFRILCLVIVSSCIDVFSVIPSTQMEDARVGLQASLLVRSSKTGELFVNFDPEILTQIREVNCMNRMNLEIPPFAAVLQQKQNSLKKNYNKLQVDVVHVCPHEILWFEMKWFQMECIVIRTGKKKKGIVTILITIVYLLNLRLPPSSSC